jgi:hypothetical protein
MYAQRQQVVVPELLADVLDQNHLRGVVGHLRREAAHQAGALVPSSLRSSSGWMNLPTLKRPTELVRNAAGPHADHREECFYLSIGSSIGNMALYRGL